MSVLSQDDVKSVDYFKYYFDKSNKKDNYIPIIELNLNVKCNKEESYQIGSDGIDLTFSTGGKVPIFYSQVARLAMTPTGTPTKTVYSNIISGTYNPDNDIRIEFKGAGVNTNLYYKNNRFHLWKGGGYPIDDSNIPLNGINAGATMLCILHFSDDVYILMETCYYFLLGPETGFNEVKESPMTMGFLSIDTLNLKNAYRESMMYVPIYEQLALHLLGIAKHTNPDDPYDGGDDKGDDDNTAGDYDHTSDSVPEPDLPSVSVTDSGLVTLFAPTQSQLKALADYLWSDAFSLDSFKKMLNNPMDCILGLTIVPVNVPHGSAREITVGNIVTTVSCNICPTQYVKVDCGTFTFDRHNMTNSYLDYAPYSKCYLYLPFIGVQEINIDDFMQSTMHVVYHVDILTGAMFCYVMRDNSVMYTYMGQCAENVPLSSSSYSNTIGSIMSAAASIVGVASVAATGGASAPVAAGLLAGASTSTANAVTSLKPSVAHSGSIGGGAGIMGVNYPYLIFNTPHVSIPSQQRHYTGYPSNQIVKLSALKGFNVIQAINLSVSGANDSEMNEIESILKGGVIL